jgi:hypothetical protein
MPLSELILRPCGFRRNNNVGPRRTVGLAPSAMGHELPRSTFPLDVGFTFESGCLAKTILSPSAVISVSPGNRRICSSPSQSNPDSPFLHFPVVGAERPRDEFESDCVPGTQFESSQLHHYCITYGNFPQNAPKRPCFRTFSRNKRVSGALQSGEAVRKHPMSPEASKAFPADIPSDR